MSKAIDCQVSKSETTFTYILLCNDSTLYTGWTNNLAKRLKAHKEGRGAKYTKARLPVKLVYFETFASKSEAMKRESQIKKLSKIAKLKLIENFSQQDLTQFIES